MSYGKVHDVFWDDDKIEALSDRAALLALFLITGPHRNAIGCFKLGLGAITDIPRFGEWGIEGASEALRELADMGFIVRDDRTGWTFITNALKHDPIKQDKAAVHALSLTTRVPKNSEVYEALKGKLEPQLDAHAKALDGKDGWPMPDPSKGHRRGIEDPTKAQPSPLPSPSPSPAPSPEPVGGADAPTTTADDGLDIPEFLKRAQPDNPYRWEGRVIRLLESQYDQWRQAFPHIPDFDAELQICDDYLTENPSDDGKWFFRTSSWLKRTNEAVKHGKRPNHPTGSSAHATLYAGFAAAAAVGRPDRVEDDWAEHPGDSEGAYPGLECLPAPGRSGAGNG